MEVFFVGEITGGRGFPSRDLFCKWEVVHGEGWVLLEGTKDGQTQVDSPLDGDVSVWCHPIDLHYRTETIAGWPKLKLSVWHHDFFSRNELYGYGFCNLPCAPGHHTVECATWRPKGTMLEELSTFFLGGAPQLINDAFVVSGQERNQLRTVTMGTVQVNIGVILKNHTQHGVHTS